MFLVPHGGHPDKRVRSGGRLRWEGRATNELLAVRYLRTLPVVTLGGDAVAHVKDTVLDAAAGRITGFDLTGRTLLSGPLPRDLPWSAVHSLGRHAVMVRDSHTPHRHRAFAGCPRGFLRRHTTASVTRSMRAPVAHRSRADADGPFDRRPVRKPA